MKNTKDLKNIGTENSNKNSRNLHKKSILEIIKIINKEDSKISKDILKQKDNIAKAIRLCVNSIGNGNRVFYIGAGTSGRLGVLDASEMPPTFGVDKDTTFIGIIAGGDNALRNPIEGAEDDSKQVIKDLEKYKFNKNDVLIGISASGRTPYVVGGINYANDIGAKTISIATSFNSKIGKLSNVGIDVNIGAEVVTGSTRMKSGTAQKMLLNIISTATMIQLGKVYDNLMINVRTSNEKLKVRAISIVKKVTGLENEDDIKQKLEDSNWVTPVAIAMIKFDLTLEEAKKLIEDRNWITKL